MPNQFLLFFWVSFVVGLYVDFTTNLVAGSKSPLLAGASEVSINPTNFPVRVNAMFTERSADKVVDDLKAKSLALESGGRRVVFCVVDTCMMARDLIDQAKVEASKRTGWPTSCMLVSATHTHSAPSAMGCLGSRIDPVYASYLPGRIAECIAQATRAMQPAELGWGQKDDWTHTYNRRWIRRPDRMITDPFGNNNVRAHMHPGHESPDAVGPSGPVDPQLTVVALRRVSDQRPLAVLANYSMHYYESALLSSDYFGRYAKHLGDELNADLGFVGIMTQGTSGDLMWMDYGQPRIQVGYDRYAQELATESSQLIKNFQWRRSVPISIVQSFLPLSYRVPDEQRLNWARNKAATVGDRLPSNLPEVYAFEAIYLHEKPKTELVLQAIGLGDLGIAALPNEVFAITGLKLKSASPFKATFNIELANGAEGYIPPPEQHLLGGYTTWPARTAGLETNAEPKIVDSLLKLLESASGKNRKPHARSDGPYAKRVLRDRPIVYWRMEEIAGSIAEDAVGGLGASIEAGVALYLPGVDGRVGFKTASPPTLNAFSKSKINRSFHFAGGRLGSKVKLLGDYTIELWLWNGLPVDARSTTGHLYGRSGAVAGFGLSEQLGIVGTSRPGLAGRLFFSVQGKGANSMLFAQTPLQLRRWHHVVLVRKGNKVTLYLDGKSDPEVKAALPLLPSSQDTIYFGGDENSTFNFEGKLDEIAIYPRALTAREISSHFRVAGINFENMGR